jgi:hypothetical protein
MIYPNEAGVPSLVVDDGETVTSGCTGPWTTFRPVAPYVPSIDYVGTPSLDPDTRQARFGGGIDTPDFPTPTSHRRSSA